MSFFFFKLLLCVVKQSFRVRDGVEFLFASWQVLSRLSEMSPWVSPEPRWRGRFLAEFRAHGDPFSLDRPSWGKPVPWLLTTSNSFASNSMNFKVNLFPLENPWIRPWVIHLLLKCRVMEFPGFCSSRGMCTEVSKENFTFQETNQKELTGWRGQQAFLLPLPRYFSYIGPRSSKWTSRGSVEVRGKGGDSVDWANVFLLSHFSPAWMC